MASFGRNRSALAIGGAVSAALLAYGASRFEAAPTLAALRRAEPLHLVIALGLFVALYPIRGFRWSRILAPISIVPVKTSTEVIAIGALANNLLPARLGDVARAFVLGRARGVSGAAVLSTVLIERIFDGLTVVLALSLVLALEPPEAAWVGGVGLLTGAIFLSALSVATSIAIFEDRALAAFRGLARPLPRAIAGKVVGILERLGAGCRALRSPSAWLVTGSVSATIWSLEVLVYAVVARGLGIELGPGGVPVSGLFLMLGVLNLGLAAPSLPAFVGVFEALVVSSLSLYGVRAEEALAFALVLHAVHFFGSTLFGLASLARHGLRIRDLGATAAGEHEAAPRGAS
ncbi:MAG: flippase-like domain-containing protein [Deltaproteobacteria bacterium]|nr:flippase-like domain-containing protein [Deltaproteobacteria bacterium]